MVSPGLRPGYRLFATVSRTYSTASHRRFRRTPRTSRLHGAEGVPSRLRNCLRRRTATAFESVSMMWPLVAQMNTTHLSRISMPSRSRQPAPEGPSFSPFSSLASPYLLSCGDSRSRRTASCSRLGETRCSPGSMLLRPAAPSRRSGGGRGSRSTTLWHKHVSPKHDKVGGCGLHRRRAEARGHHEAPSRMGCRRPGGWRPDSRRLTVGAESPWSQGQPKEPPRGAMTQTSRNAFPASAGGGGGICGGRGWRAVGNFRVRCSAY